MKTLEELYAELVALEQERDAGTKVLEEKYPQFWHYEPQGNSIFYHTETSTVGVSMEDDTLELGTCTVELLSKYVMEVKAIIDSDYHKYILNYFLEINERIAAAELAVGQLSELDEEIDDDF